MSHGRGHQRSGFVATFAKCWRLYSFPASRERRQGADQAASADQVLLPPLRPQATTANAPQVSTARAAGEGFLDTAGLGFRDEIYGLSRTSGLPEWMGGFRAFPGMIRMGIEKLRNTGEWPAYEAYTSGQQLGLPAGLIANRVNAPAQEGGEGQQDQGRINDKANGRQQNRKGRSVGRR